MDTLNDSGSQLSAKSPGEGASRIDDYLKRDNKRFNTIDEQVKKRADKLNIVRQKSMEVRSGFDINIDT